MEIAIHESVKTLSSLQVCLLSVVPNLTSSIIFNYTPTYFHTFEFEQWDVLSDKGVKTPHKILLSEYQTCGLTGCA